MGEGGKEIITPLQISILRIWIWGFKFLEIKGGTKKLPKSPKLLEMLFQNIRLIFLDLSSLPRFFPYAKLGKPLYIEIHIRKNTT